MTRSSLCHKKNVTLHWPWPCGQLTMQRKNKDRECIHFVKKLIQVTNQAKNLDLMFQEDKEAQEEEHDFLMGLEMKRWEKRSNPMNGAVAHQQISLSFHCECQCHHCFTVTVFSLTSGAVSLHEFW